MESEHSPSGLYIALISVHGLIRGEQLELGRDADTGGQTKYVVELARALARQDDVAQVDLFTRAVVDPRVSPDYCEPIEELSGNGDNASARIVRINAGPEEYLPKEQLWDHLDSFADNMLDFFRRHNRFPQVLHSHYADAGYVGTKLSHQLGVPLVHTGHSLGRVKRLRLLAAGLSGDNIEKRYTMSRRVEAEEQTLISATRVITSTHQEIDEQYGLYDHCDPKVMRVVAPGTDLQQFHPPQEEAGEEHSSDIAQAIRRFLHDPNKPVVLALSRPDGRKNISALVTAFGDNPELRERANLVIIAGNRDDISDLDDGAQEVWTDLLMSIDRYDLYGSVAYPKHHLSEDVPIIYRLATASGGVFVNPALTEPFGLTLIEAAASGLPIVATDDGGPKDIIGNCKNGNLIDPLDHRAIAQALLNMLNDRDTWERLAANGLAGVREHYNWQAHSARYLQVIKPIIEKTEPLFRPPTTRRPMLFHDRAIFTGFDENLLGDDRALDKLVDVVHRNRKMATFGIATGRRLDSALKNLKRYNIPLPDVLITSGGSEIHYAPPLARDIGWALHIDHRWTPQAVRRVLAEVQGLRLQDKLAQSRFQLSYFIDPAVAPSLEAIKKILFDADQTVNLIQSFDQYLNVLPIRASKGLALRYVAARWDIPLEQVLAVGGSGADEDMMRGNTLAVVIGNRDGEELSQLVDVDRVYFAKQNYAAGILEAIDHYDFFNRCAPPAKADAAPPAGSQSS